MRSVTAFALATFVCSAVVSGLPRSARSADNFASDPSSLNPSAPGLLPLPEFASPWAGGAPYPNRASLSYAALPPAPDYGYGYGYGGQAVMTRYQAPPPAAPGPAAPDASRDLYNALQSPATVIDSPDGCGGNCGGGDCGCDCGCGGFWFGYVGGLVMTRNQPNKYWTTYDQANNNFQNLNTEDANVHWDGGGEFTVGYRHCCDGGFELTYWGVWNMAGSASVSSPTNNLGTPLDTTNGAAGLTLGGQVPDAFFTNAHAVYLQRDDQVNNVEINFTYNPWGYDNCGWNLTWLAGIRYFKFDENLLWTSVAGGFNLNDNGGADQANLNVHCENDLWGVQWGTVVSYRFGSHLSIFAIPKVGIYCDDAESQSRYYRGDGVVGFDITGHKDTCSFLGSFDLGLSYDIGCHWSIVGGYRVVAVSGIALSDNQIPHFLAAADEFADTKVNGDLVVHGAFFGATFRY